LKPLDSASLIMHSGAITGCSGEVLSFTTLLLSRKSIEEKFLKRLPGSFDLLSIENDPSPATGVQSVADALEQKLIEVASLIEERCKVLQEMNKITFDMKEEVSAEFLKAFSSGSSSSSSLEQLSHNFLTTALTPLVQQIEKTCTLQAGVFGYFACVALN
jgi:hypothetical protein